MPLQPYRKALQGRNDLQSASKKPDLEKEEGVAPRQDRHNCLNSGRKKAAWEENGSGRSEGVAVAATLRMDE